MRGEKLFDIRDWMAEPSPLSVTFVGLNADPMKAKVRGESVKALAVPLPVSRYCNSSF